MLVTDIKNEIKNKLDAMVTAGTLGSVIIDDFKTDYLQRDIAKFPCAILTTPRIESHGETNRENMRTHVFEIVIMMKGENIQTASDVETLMENVINVFDDDPTLGGFADGGVEPAVSNPEPVSAGDKSYILFTVSIRAKAMKLLGF